MIYVHSLFHAFGGKKEHSHLAGNKFTQHSTENESIYDRKSDGRKNVQLHLSQARQIQARYTRISRNAAACEDHARD